MEQKSFPLKVFGVSFEDDLKTVLTMEQPYRSKTVIVATGSMGHQATLKGESALLGKGVSLLRHLRCRFL